VFRLLQFGGLCIAIAGISFGASGVPKATGGEAVPIHRVKLDPFVAPPIRTAGLIVKVRVNDGPPLRLLLDSGANMITLDPRAAAKSHCGGGTGLELVGAAAQAAAGARQVRTTTVEIGDLVLRDLPVLIAGGGVGEGIQGVFPLSVFSTYLIRLDVPKKTLELLPYPATSPDGNGNLQALSSNSLLFVKGTVNDRRNGYFLLDTGASYSAISKVVARELELSESLAERVPLQAGTMELDAPRIDKGVRLRFGGKELGIGPVVVIDLSVSSRYHNLDIAGLIGLPALTGSVVLVNYRDGLVRIDSR
jgi:predicted aspartyl protease